MIYNKPLEKNVKRVIVAILLVCVFVSSVAFSTIAFITIAIENIQIKEAFATAQPCSRADTASGRCIPNCGSGYHYDAAKGLCAPDNPKAQQCREGTHFDAASGRCIPNCGSGYHNDAAKGLCAPDNPKAQQCREGTHFDTASGRCIPNCGSGYHNDAARGYLCAPGLPTTTQPNYLTGMWQANDGGTYYLRQDGNTLWWNGMSGGNDGRTFNNVFRGTITTQSSGIAISGEWVDVPRGTSTGIGALSLKVVNPLTLQRVSQTGGFAATTWQKIK